MSTPPPASRERLIEDALALLVASLDTDTGGIGDGTHLHRLVLDTDGDGWNEPHSVRYRCDCGTWDGIDWTQTDPAQSDRPTETDAALAWRAHVLTALGEPWAITHPDSLVCSDCLQPAAFLVDRLSAGPHFEIDASVCADCHPDRDLNGTTS